VSTPEEDQERSAAPEEDAEVIDAVPVPEGAPSAGAVLPVAEPPRGGLLVSSPIARQAAAVAVTGFAAGAATVAVVRARRTRKAAKRRRKGARALGEVRATRSFLVDVHVLGSKD
jgi:hypothetical protein